MKKFVLYMFAAVLGGAVALGAYKVIEPASSHQAQKDAFPSMAKFVNYAPGNPGSGVPSLDFTYSADKALPAVVHIQSTQHISRSVRQGQGFDLQQIPSPFRDFFRNPNSPQYPNRQGMPEEQLQQGSGSGVIISSDGYIVTNNHVVADADELMVTLNDHREYKAKLIGTDPSTDVALIKIEEKDLANVQFANSDQIKVGQWVVAVGNPFNLESTVTAGIVSAKARSINIMQDKTPIESFIQTDAVINPGNSGGALVDLQGNLVGINTAIASPTGSYAGYGFAVPSDIVQKVVADLKAYGVVQRAYIGAIIRGIDGNFAKENGLTTLNGVYVDSLTANSAAAAAGMKKGDVIIAVDDQPTESSPALLEMIGRHRPGDKVKLTVLRKNREEELQVTLKNSDGTTDVVKKETPSAILHALGADFETISKADAKERNLSGGVRVLHLNKGKLLDETDVQEGYIITKVDGKKVEKVEDLVKILENLKGGVMLEGIYPGSDQVYYYAFGL